MATGPTVIWSSVPVGSKIKLQVAGDKRTYDFVAIVTLNGSAHPSLEIGDVDPGPAIVAVDAVKQRWAFAPTLIVTSDIDTPIVFKAWLEDGGGGVVQVPDGAGGTTPAQAQWSSGTTGGSTLEVKIFVRAVAA